MKAAKPDVAEPQPMGHRADTSAGAAYTERKRSDRPAMLYAYNIHASAWLACAAPVSMKVDRSDRNLTGSSPRRQTIRLRLNSARLEHRLFTSLCTPATTPRCSSPASHAQSTRVFLRHLHPDHPCGCEWKDTWRMVWAQTVRCQVAEKSRGRVIPV